MTSPRPLLKAAMKARGLSNERLREESGLKCTVSSISRKLNGLQELTAAEASAMSSVLGVKVPGVGQCLALERRFGVAVAWAPERKRGAA